MNQQPTSDSSNSAKTPLTLIKKIISTQSSINLSSIFKHSAKLAVLILTPLLIFFPAEKVIAQTNPTPTPPPSRLSKVDIYPEYINLSVNDNGVGLSTLAYDTNNQPVWSGVTYEWGISSSNSIGTLEVNGNIATFLPLNPGRGDLYVIARSQGEHVISSIPVTVSFRPILQGDANGDGDVDGVDYIYWLIHYNQSTSNSASDGDFNDDNYVDGLDYIVWLNNYGT